MKIFTALLIALMTALAACGPTETLPTLVPTQAEPSLTPTEVIQASATPLATATARVRPTLPPTWTLTPTLSPTPTATENIPTRTPVVIQNTLPAACNTFDAIFAETDVQFPVGTAPRVSWTPVEGAELYRLILSGPGGFILNDQIYLSETTYTFDAALFEAGGAYGWEVYPINPAGIQMCYAVGLELLPLQPLSPGG